MEIGIAILIILGILIINRISKNSWTLLEKSSPIEWRPCIIKTEAGKFFSGYFLRDPGEKSIGYWYDTDHSCLKLVNQTDKWKYLND